MQNRPPYVCRKRAALRGLDRVCAKSLVAQISWGAGARLRRCIMAGQRGTTMVAASALPAAGRSRAVAGTHCVIFGLVPLQFLQLFDASARPTP
jgi:hypothetical protein